MRFLIVRNKYNSKAFEASFTLEMYLTSQGIEYECFDSNEVPFFKPIVGLVGDMDQFDMVIVLGGDGSILRAAGQVGYRRIPILCTNYGHLGFMANSNAEGLIPLVAAALSGDAITEARTNLRVCVELQPTEFTRDPTEQAIAQQEAPVYEFFSLNEMALTRGERGRSIDFTYHVDGIKIADMRGDGLVVSSATGSTGYALSAGGPLVSPGYNGLVVVPIAPHTLHSRALVTAPSDVVEIVMRDSDDNRESSLFIDGEPVHFDSPIQRITVSTGDEPTILLRYKSGSFYERASEVFFS